MSTYTTFWTAGRTLACVALLGFFPVQSSLAQSYSWTTYAGNSGGPGYGDATGTNAQFWNPLELATDSSNAVYVADNYNNVIRKITAGGVVTTLAGNASISGSTNGTGTAATFNAPVSVAVDSSKNVYVADNGNMLIRKITSAGVVTTLAGTGGEFSDPEGVAVDASGNVYVADRGNNRIQVFDNDGNYKSSITSGGDPEAICISPGAHQYLFSSNSNPANDLDKGGEIYKLELNGTVVGTFGQAGKGPKDFGSVNGIDCRNPNALYVAEAGNWRVTKVDLH